MMRWIAWQPKDDADAPPSYALHRAFGWMVLQQQVTELVDVWYENMRLPKKEEIMVWQDVPLHIEKSDK